jgi:anti-anti-sigma factor
MNIVERNITMDEFRKEQFESFAAPPFGAALHDGVFMEMHVNRVVVLDLVGALAGSESRKLRVHINRVIERGERTIVINLKSVTKVDPTGLGELISCYVSIIHSGGAMLLANPPRQFCRLVERAKFL